MTQTMPVDLAVAKRTDVFYERDLAVQETLLKVCGLRTGA